MAAVISSATTNDAMNPPSNGADANALRSPSQQGGGGGGVAAPGGTGSAVGNTSHEELTGMILPHEAAALAFGERAINDPLPGSCPDSVGNRTIA